MGRLTVVLRAKGIVRSPGPSVFALMDLPLLYLASIAGEPLPSGLDEEPEGGGPAWSVAAE
jgi:hypothetical protein